MHLALDKISIDVNVFLNMNLWSNIICKCAHVYNFRHLHLS